MTRLHYSFIFILSALCSSSCMRLDPFMFVGQKLEQYQLSSSPSNKTPATFYQIPEKLIQEVSFTSDDQKTKLYGAWLINDNSNPAIPANNRTVFYCHGNSKNLNNYQDRLVYLYRAGYNVFLFDYRGFGKSESSSTTTLGLKEDGLGAFKYFISQNSKFPNSTTPTQNPILFYGFSLGNYPCLQILASDLVNSMPQIGMIAEAPFSSAQSLMQSSVNLTIPASLLSDGDFNNIAAIQEAGRKLIPIMILHGQKDNYVRVQNGQELFRFHRPNSDSCTVNAPLTTTLSSYLQRVRTFDSCGNTTLASDGSSISRNNRTFTRLVEVFEAEHSTIPNALGLNADGSGTDLYTPLVKDFADQVFATKER